MKIKNIILSVLGLLCANVFSQETAGDPFQYNPVEKTSIANPEQSNLLKFTNIQPGSHTGVMGYSIPIYEIRGKGFSLPISLSYHGMGIKVDEQASSVGLGWSLNAGGVSLSQETRGGSDLGAIQQITPIDPITFNPDPFYNNEQQGGYFDTTSDYWKAMGMTGLSTPLMDGTPHLELSPDYFSYSLLNNSGKFIIDNSNKKHTIPKDNIRFRSDGGKEVLIDSQGIEYTFKSYVMGYNLTIGGESSSGDLHYGYIIESIFNPQTQETINFEYQKVKYRTVSSYSVNIKKRAMYNSFTDCGGHNALTGSVTYAENVEFPEYILKKISYNDTEVLFIYDDNGRLDMNGIAANNKGGVILKDIIVQKKNAGQNDTPLRKYKLTTDYFISNPENNDTYLMMNNSYFGITSDTQFYRLKLKKVEELMSEIEYQFEYHETYNGKTLPPRFSYKTDYWGMFNGVDNTSPFSEGEYFSLEGDKVYFEGGKKMPDLNYAQLGTLKKIILPTGGSQEFEYELDDFRNLDFDDDLNSALPIHDYQKKEFYYPDTLDPNGYNVELYVNIPINEPTYKSGMNYELTFISPDEPTTDEYGLPMADEAYHVLKFLKKKDGVETEVYSLYKTVTVQFPQLDEDYEYYFRIEKVKTPISDPNDISIEFKWIYDNITYPLNRKAGTLRVKSITLNDENNAPQIKRRFEYKDFENPVLSSGLYTGKVLDKPYISTEPAKLEYECDSNGNCNWLGSGGSCSYYNFSNNGVYNLSSSFGKSMSYNNIVDIYEDLKDSSNNYKIESVFSTIDSPLDQLQEEAPFVPEPTVDYMRGLLIEQRMFDSNNDTVRITKNKYNVGNEEFVIDDFFNKFSSNYIQGINNALSPILIASASGADLISAVGMEKVYLFKTNYSYIYSGWIKQLSTTTTEYKNNQPTIFSKTEYKYRDQQSDDYEFKSILPSEEIKYTSLDDETIITRFYYPQDLINSQQGSIMQTLTDANRISEPVMTESYRVKQSTEEKLYQTINKYNDFELNSGDVPLVSEVFVKKGGGNIDIQSDSDRVFSFKTYDDFGNPVEFKREDGESVILVWDFQKQYQIAKIQGRSYESLSNQEKGFINTLVTNSTNYALTPNDFENLRKIDGAMVTGYIYQPLVGLTTIIQPNGQKMTYEYDDSGRLIRVKDHEGNILNENDYHYYSQP